ncbi:MAG: single-stranded DNA-binding protein [Selenomonadaceae bacterium]|nr:single-stranded DNA-binding protein [Selenomonadaceae bacterium]
MNRVFLSGRLTRDPELKQGNGGSNFARAGIAVDRQTKDKTADFFNLVAFGKTAEFLSRWFRQGSKLLVEGHLRQSQYEGKDGNKRISTDVIVDAVEFADSKKKAVGSGDFEGEPVHPDDTPF